MQFRGWVPTVTGNLSFSEIGHTNHPTKSRICRSVRTVLVQQRRDLLDVLIPMVSDTETGAYFREKIANRVINISGHFSFLCLMKMDLDNETMSGRIAVVPGRRNRRQIASLARRIDTADESAEDEDPFARDCEEIQTEAEAIAIAIATFTLDRDGETRLALDVTDPSAGRTGSIQRTIANQAFYFLKDICHVHQHHEPSHDAITELTPFDPDDPDAWVADTRHCLFRAIIRYKRYRNERALFRASGILAYERAFEKLHGAKKPHSGTFNVEELESSLAVSREEIRHFDHKRLTRSETTRNFFFAMFGLVISGTFLARLSSKTDVEPDRIILEATRLVAQNPLETIAVVFLVSKVYSFWTHRSDPADVATIRANFRLLQGLRHRHHMLVNLGLTAILASLCWWLLT